MAAFEDNNPFASPSSPSSSRANSYAPFTSYPFSPTSSSHAPHHSPQNPSFDSSNRPTTSSSEDAPAYQYRATNSDFSEPQMETTGETAGVGGVGGEGVGVGGGVSREKEGESCCKIDDVLRKNPEMRIVISDAGKASDGGANFIAYTIEVGVGNPATETFWRLTFFRE